MRLVQALSTRSVSMSLDELLSSFKSSLGYSLFGESPTTLGSKQEEIQRTFAGYVQQAYKQNGIVFACMLARLMLFSEARFQFRRRVLGRPGELFGSKALAPLEEPWPGATTGNLLTRVIQDVDLAGNFFAAKRPGNRIMRMRPDWVTIILGSNSDSDVGFGDVDAEVLGYVYSPGGPNSGKPTMPFLRNEVAHFAPIPDPLADFRGMSWLTPVLREITADNATTDHKLKFFENGATPNVVVTFDATLQREAFEDWMKLFKENYEGSENAYRTMVLGAGAKADVVGSDLKSVEFKAIQAAGENRIAVAAGVPGIVVGLAEGLEAGTLANYGQARRHFSDATIRPLWRGVSGALAPIIDVPLGAELWFDARDISYLQEDQKDAASIQHAEAETIKLLIEAGFEPDSVLEAVTAEDFSRLKGNHTGLTSVQLQAPVDTSQNGNSPAVKA